MNEDHKISLAAAIKGVLYVGALLWGYSLLNQNVEARLTALETTANNAKLSEIPAALSRIEQKIDSIDRVSEKRRSQ